MVDLPPSRKDITTAPRKDGIIDLSPAVRRHDSYLESLDPGILRGRFATPRPTTNGTPLLVGGEAGGDGNERLWEYDDRATVIVATGTQVFHLSHEPFDESLFVRWHPAGRGGVPITSEFFTVDGQNVIITDPGVLAVGDVFSFQYEYEDTEDALDFEFIAAVRGVFHYPGDTVTFTPPPAMQEGDFLVVSIRGDTAPGGGESIAGVGTSDPRLSHLYTATPPVMEAVFVGFATGSTADIVTTITERGDISPGALGEMLILRGVNQVAAFSGDSTGSGVTPQVAAAAAIAVTWDGNHSFTQLTATPPTGYTYGGDTGLNYAATCLAYWSDPSEEITLAGTYSGEGCLIIGLS